MKFSTLWLVTLLLAGASLGFAQEPDPLAEIRTLRLQGALAEAQALAEQELGSASENPQLEVALRLELARIHDRFGLHHNTRPVAAALEQINAAAVVAERAGPQAQAAIALAETDYYYRAEMSERAFPTAMAHARHAIALFQRLNDAHGEAEAVHKLGLIHLQRGELEEARALFDRSLERDQAAGARMFFRGEYERHVGFVHLGNGDTAAAIPYFERSLAARREAGALDASLFAAASLASALITLGRIEEARPPLLYAMMVATRIDSPTGTARNGLILGRLHEQEGDTDAARIAYEMAGEVAASIGSASISAQARDALERLAAQ